MYNTIINSVACKPPETGGILGGTNNIVTCFAKDIGNSIEGICNYIPDIKNINNIINDWSLRKLDFYGIYHIHFWNVSTLSFGDCEYIKKIMLAMPKEVSLLYFPILILPRRVLFSYYAVNENRNITINNDIITMI